MAEFQEVMRQWARLCNDVPGKSDCVSICSNKKSGYICPMRESGLCNKSVSSQTDKDRQEGERIILSWAAEHPEPVYETWFEWLEGQGVTAIINGEPYYDSMDREIYLKQPAFTPKAFDHIPADIAQKLGIEPKEG